MPARALVCGAGVGGLSLGLALERAGYEVTVFEQAPEARTAGVGLNLWPNAVRVLHALGLREDYARISSTLSSYLVFRTDGRLVRCEDVGAYQELYGAPLTGVYRRDLNAMLAQALGLDRIRFGHELVAFDDLGDGVECRFANGATASGDFLVGADGAFSRVRSQLFGTVAFHGVSVRWRGLFDVAAADIDPTEQVDVLDVNGHLGWLPIGRGRAYWYAAGTGLDDKDTALSYFTSWTNTRVPEIVEATPDDAIIRNELGAPETELQRWGIGRVTLLGDAAHPPLPGIAQGAGQTLEDAVVLARCLAEQPGIEDALRSYESARIPKIARVTRVSAKLFSFEETFEKPEEAHPVFRYADVVEDTLGIGI
jgi:FAD-dependent urate hydroxylase